MTLYNDNILQTRALRTNDIQTQDINFFASLLFVQNKEPFTTKAQKERVISLHFKKDQITDETTAAFNKLIQIPAAEMAWFFVHIMQQRENIEAEWFKSYQDAKKDLAAIEDARLIENHALLLAFHRLLCEIIGVEHDLTGYIEILGRKKHEDCNLSEQNLANYFLDLVLSLDPENYYQNTERNIEIKEKIELSIDLKDSELFIHLPRALAVLQKVGSYMQGVSVGALQQELKAHEAYLRHDERHYFRHADQSARNRCFVFNANKLEGLK